MGSLKEARLESFYDAYPRIEAEFQAVLDTSLRPRGPEFLYEVVARLGLPRGASVVDLGSGDGKHTLELAKRFGFVVRGIDPVPRHIELAREALAAAAQRDSELTARVTFVRHRPARAARCRVALERHACRSGEHGSTPH